MLAKAGRKSCDGCKYDLGGGCCSINSEYECREGGGFELYDSQAIYKPEDSCVICGNYIPEGRGMVCPGCEKKYKDRENAPYGANITTLRMLLQIERAQHAETRRKLEKASHDRDRYKKRIRFIDARHQLVCRELYIAKKEANTLNTAVTLLERRLFENEQQDAQP